MAQKALSFTQHAEDMLAEREIEREWVERTIAQPETIEADARRAGVTLAFRRIPERDDRILRVAFVETDQEIRVVTTYFDRGRRPKLAAGG
jgi:hypothetical protein